jgi:hypothetical protein
MRNSREIPQNSTRICDPDLGSNNKLSEIYINKKKERKNQKNQKKRVLMS